MKRLAVSGATGFVGGHLSRWLPSQQCVAQPLSRAMIGSADLPVALRGMDAVIHLAARAHRLRDAATDPAREFHEVNVGITRVMAQACVSAGVKRFVFVSSAGVLGSRSPTDGFTDASSAAPHDDYTRSKLAAEQMLTTEFGGRLEVVILRPPMVYGPGAPGNFDRILKAVLTGFPLPLGGLRAPRSLISVRNLCDVMLRAATCSSVEARPILVSDREVTSVAELAAAIAEAVGRRNRGFIVPASMLSAALKLAGRSGDLHRLLEPFVLRGSLACSSLGWSPEFEFAHELEWTVRATGRGI